jgi:hypothetical protein
MTRHQQKKTRIGFEIRASHVRVLILSQSILSQFVHVYPISVFLKYSITFNIVCSVSTLSRIIV